jgi:carbonic anhydrase
MLRIPRRLCSSKPFDAASARHLLLQQNKHWAQSVTNKDPSFFQRLSKQQSPQFLWIGCSDSRVPANEIVGLMPGEVFVHRNIANVVSNIDLNLLSVVQYAVEVLKVGHIIVCGHYGCGGVRASMDNKQFGLLDNWLREIKDVYSLYKDKLEALPKGQAREDLLVELNAIHGALNVCRTPIVQNAWAKGQPLAVHSWCYRLEDGMIRDLGHLVEGPEGVEELYRIEVSKDTPHK